MKVSFVTVSYKTPDLVRILLNGVSAARFSFPFEYFLVNNAPGDGTSEMVCERFPWVTVIDAPRNVGFGAGNNLAFREARGEYLMLFNPDLTVCIGEMEKLLAFADAHPEVGIVGPKVLHPNATLQRTFHRFHTTLIPIYRRTPLGRTPWGRRALERFLMKDVDETSVHDVDGIFGAAMLLRRRALEEIGHFDERFFMYFEDVDLCRRAWTKGWKVCYAPVSTFIHYLQRESDIRYWWLGFAHPVSRAHIASAVRYFWKYRGQPSPRNSLK